MKKKDIITNNVARSRSEKQASFLANLMCWVLLLLVLVPLMHSVSLALSRGTAVTAGRVYLWPVNIQWEGFKLVLFETGFLTSVWNSIKVTILGTFLSLATTVLFAYPMSRPDLKGKKFLTMVLVVSMNFSGGLVPTYLLISSLGLINSYWALILPGVLSIYNMLVIRNYFEGLPEGVVESARIDGAGDLRVLWHIVLPMSTPVLATNAMLFAVGYWNNYFSASLYIQDMSMMTLPVFMRNLIADADILTDQINRDETSIGLLHIDSVKAVVTVLGAIPIVAAYPLCQRYLIQGITIGSEKG